MPIDDTADVDIGLILVDKKLISEEQLNKAKEQHAAKGGYLSQHLIDLGYIQDSEVTTILTCQYGFCYLPLKAYDIQETALQLIPFSFACDFCVIPIEKCDMLLTVAMADPLNKGVLEILRQLTHCEIIVFIATRNEIKTTIEKYYGTPFKKFELDKYHGDSALRDNLAIRRISSGLYIGPNRRKYRRLCLELVGEYFSYPSVIKTKVMNISMSGILFESTKPLPKGAQMAMNIHLNKDTFITAVIEVCRCEAKYVIDTSTIESRDHAYYEIGTFFNFVSDENLSVLAEFLKQQLAGI